MKNGEWELYDIKAMNLEKHENITTSDKANWHSGLHPSVLVAAVAAPTRMSLSKLYRALIHSKGFGILNDDTFMVFVTRIMTPLLALSTLAVSLLILVSRKIYLNIYQRLFIVTVLTIGVVIVQQPAFLVDQWINLSLNFMILFLGVYSIIYLRKKEA